MKNLSFFVLFTVFISGFCLAQAPPMPSALTTTRFVLDKNTVVKDTAGKQYGYQEWSAMMRTGKYIIKQAGIKKGTDGKPEYVLVPLFDANGQPIDRKTKTQVRYITAPRPQSTDPSKPNFVEPAKPNESTQFHPGDIFKPFNEKDIYGEKFDLKKMKGKVLVINFWFIGCPPCRAEIPDLNKLVEHYKDNKDVVFLAVCLDEKYDIKEFIKTTPFNYHIIDDGRFVAEKYGVKLYPTNVVVNKDGKVVFSSVSFQYANPYWLTKTIDEALQVPVANPAP
ncbi:thiol-disulfide isomerase/thioredoxin [Mucilaginibacter gracilis]|uniref:Thiol-disulfide isomerase/thioredoxin n=1 Tax=Mucilaginibacter gracilis TaxID=423350 RepID=A0A495JAV8_9SPHI|nr:TlpA disulfide reductase family protein [Mucilaginibacter gracilis]RKR85618.1 thiol-disulfide isomerase/thioredoxin [Mucilaginibacter gracilis]